MFILFRAICDQICIRIRRENRQLLFLSEINKTDSLCLRWKFVMKMCFSCDFPSSKIVKFRFHAKEHFISKYRRLLLFHLAKIPNTLFYYQTAQKKKAKINKCWLQLTINRILIDEQIFTMWISIKKKKMNLIKVNVKI